jgi:hypothetical protein
LDCSPACNHFTIRWHKALFKALGLQECPPVREIVPWVIGLVPFTVLFLILWWDYRSRQRRLKHPFTKFLLRPPGESLRLRIEELDDVLNERLFQLILLGVITAIALRTFWSLTPVVIAVTVLFFAASAVIAFQLRKSIKLRRDCYLGFLGERAVGEELSQLLAAGWRVFHDVEFQARPGGKPFNVDHVVVGLGGVFAIETKTRWKQLGGPQNVVVFDGTVLHFPWGAEDFGLRNAADRGAHLGQWLSGALNQSVPVQPVLALPGWSVTRKARGSTIVVSGGEIAGYFRNLEKGQKLDAQTVAAICGLLDQKCRDVGD